MDIDSDRRRPGDAERPRADDGEAPASRFAQIMIALIVVGGIVGMILKALGLF